MQNTRRGVTGRHTPSNTRRIVLSATMGHTVLCVVWRGQCLGCGLAVCATLWRGSSSLALLSAMFGRVSSGRVHRHGIIRTGTQQQCSHPYHASDQLAPMYSPCTLPGVPHCPLSLSATPLTPSCHSALPCSTCCTLASLAWSGTFTSPHARNTVASVGYSLMTWMQQAPLMMWAHMCAMLQQACCRAGAPLQSGGEQK
jgi:hypothetical protein